MSGTGDMVPGSAGSASYYTIGLDESTGTLRITMRGFWTIPIAQSFMAEIRKQAALCRGRFGRLKQLVDMVSMPVQSQEVTMILHVPSLYLPGDRIAAILDTTLAKVAARRTMDAYPEGVERSAFMSATAAETWLQAYS